MNHQTNARAPIEVDFVGHATLLVRTADVNCLFDPVLFETFHEGLFEIYPPRTVRITEMPVPDMVVLTHRHNDHFDIRSLRALPTRNHIVIPDDALLREVVQRIGFKEITVVRDWDTLLIGETELLFTPSMLKVPEFGVLVRTRGASFWNQVDTVIDMATVDRIAALEKHVSFLLAPWQPSFEAPLQYNKGMSFPAEAYIKLLKRAAAVSARAMAPGACGFRHNGEYCWQDQLTFPVTRERFLQDFASQPGCRYVDRIAIDPGDSVAVTPEGAFLKGDKLSWVNRSDTWDSKTLRFSPVLPSYGQRPTAKQEGVQRADAAVARVRALLQPFWASPKGVAAIERSRAWQVVFQLEVAVEPSSQSFIHIDFRAHGLPSLVVGYTPFANANAYLTLCALERLLDGETSWDRLVHSGDYRTHSSVYAANGREVRLPPPPAVFDPLWNLFPYDELERRSLELALTAPLDAEPTF